MTQFQVFYLSFHTNEQPYGLPTDTDRVVRQLFRQTEQGKGA